MTMRERLHAAPIWLASMAIPLAMAIAFAQWSWRQVEREAVELAFHTVDLLHEHLVRSLEVHDAVIEAVQVRLDGMSWTQIDDDPTIPDLLHRLERAVPNTNRIGIIDPSGQLLHISSAPFPGPRTSHSDRDYVAALHATGTAGPRSVSVGEPIIGRTSSEIVIPYARPRIGPDGQPDGGVIWATFLQSTLISTFRAVRADTNDAIGLIRDDGVVLARFPPPPSPTGQRLPADTEVLALASGPPRTGAAATSRVVSPIDGIDRLVALRRLDRAGVILAYGRPIADIRAAWFERSLPMLLLSALAMLLLLALTWRHRLSAGRLLLAERRTREEAEHAAAAERARADMEAMLRHLQRVQTLGHIAAGLVHDFRNTIQAVQAGAALIDRAIAQGNTTRARDLTTQLREVSERGAQLTKRLLAFTTNRTEPSRTCAPGPAIAATCKLLRTALGPRYRLEENFAPDLPPTIAADPAELEAALMNLIINARDAMPAGGSIAITTRRATAPPGLASGDYVELAVADAGIGMDTATLTRATEAFFTTKQDGGTGLGLTSISAFLADIGGTMHLASTQGQGTTVTLYLPAAPAQPQAAEPSRTDAG